MCVFLGGQELVEIMAKVNGVVLLAPPSDSAEAQNSVSTLVSAMKSKQKVGTGTLDTLLCWTHSNAWLVQRMTCFAKADLLLMMGLTTKALVLAVTTHLKPILCSCHKLSSPNRQSCECPCALGVLLVLLGLYSSLLK